jgi:DNA invertase Pin-like site-specific DNA recombinase
VPTAPKEPICLAHLGAGDTLMVVELSGLGRGTGDLGSAARSPHEQSLGLRIVSLGIDMEEPAGRFNIRGRCRDRRMERELLV